MKIYRRSFWKAETSKCYVIPALVLFVLFLPYPMDFIYNSECYEFHPLVLLPIGMFALVFLFMPSQYFYVILAEDRLMLRNSIYTFWKKECLYQDIVKVKVGWAGGRSLPYMQVFTKRTKKRTWQYVIDLVNPKSYNELIEDIKAKGIPVETKRLECFTKYYKPGK